MVFLIAHQNEKNSNSWAKLPPEKCPNTGKYGQEKNYLFVHLLRSKTTSSNIHFQISIKIALQLHK